jgi:hypothetical protein
VAPAPGLLEVLAYFLGILAAGFKLFRRDVKDRLSPPRCDRTAKSLPYKEMTESDGVPSPYFM